MTTTPIMFAGTARQILDHGELTFIGTATVLLRLGAFTLLTDPNFLHAGEHAYLGLGVRSKRLLEPAMQIADLPPLDLVVLSHHHGDHFDDVAARELDKTLPIVTEPHAADKLREQGFRRAIALQTWETQVFQRGDATLRVTATPGKHAPRPFGSLIPPVMGAMLEYRQGERRHRIYITGDTLVYDQLAEIPRRYGAIDLCLIHLGGTRVAGICLTMDAKQGIELLTLVRPRAAVPIHTDDYTVFTSSLRDFQATVEAADPEFDVEVEYAERGKPWVFPLRGAPAF